MVIDDRQREATIDPSRSGQTREVSLPITGMTCASCVRRVERSLAKVPGVHEATVNLATERARVAFDSAAAGIDQFRAAVEKFGYAVGPMDAPAPATDAVLGRGRSRQPRRSTSMPSSASAKSTTCAARP